MKDLLARIRTVFWITVAWTLFSLFKFGVGYFTVLDVAALPQVDLDLSSVNTDAYLTGSLLTGILAGVIGGSGIVFAWGKWLRSRSYGSALTSILFSYLGIYVIVAFCTTLYFTVNTTSLSLSDIEAWKITFLSIFDKVSFLDMLSWLVLCIFTLIVLLVDDKYGPGVFRKFLLGKYFRPQREERVFMFLDLRSSTTIAEKLGEEQYFNFLKDVFETATPGILKYRGEIYQYVGDEIVISWELESGIKNTNCIKCFFDIQSILRKKKDYFLEVYGVEPIFKAGLHYGHVMAGEVGVVKREIAFSGDVLNTTARIQNKCNELGVDILTSKQLIERLNITDGMFSPKEMGKIELRGKKELVSLFTI